MKKQVKKILAMAAVVFFVWGSVDGVAVYADDVTSCENHVYDYDCDTTCNICGAKRVASHTYDDFGRSYYYHWKVCDCGARLDSELHVYDSTTDLTCSVCGYVRHLEHNYNIPGADSTYHWMECDCGERTDVEKHGFEMKYDEVRHWKECACGTRAEDAVHVWGEGVADGAVMRYTCTICGAEKTKTPGSVGGGDNPGGDVGGGDNSGGGDISGGNTGDGGDDTQDGNGGGSGGNGGSGDDNNGGGSGSDDGSGDDGSGKQSKVDGKLLAVATGSGLTIWGGAIGGYFIYKKKKGVGIIKDIVKDVVTDGITDKL